LYNGVQERRGKSNIFGHYGNQTDLGVKGLHPFPNHHELVFHAFCSSSVKKQIRLLFFKKMCDLILDVRPKCRVECSDLK